MQLVAAVARHSPFQIAPSLDTIVPSILKAIQRDDEELREVSLQALEALVLRCSSEVTPYQQSIIQAGVQFIKYDPVSAHCSIYCGANPNIAQNYAADDDDEEMADASDEDEDDDDELDDECVFSTFSPQNY